VERFLEYRKLSEFYEVFLNVSNNEIVAAEAFSTFINEYKLIDLSAAEVEKETTRVTDGAISRIADASLTKYRKQIDDTFGKDILDNARDSKKVIDHIKNSKQPLERTPQGIVIYNVLGAVAAFLVITAIAWGLEKAGIYTISVSVKSGSYDNPETLPADESSANHDVEGTLAK